MTWEEYAKIILDNNKSWIIEKDIKSVVTKEQLKKIEYKVGE